MKYPAWYAYWCERDCAALASPKIVTQVLARGSKLAFDRTGEFFFVGGGNAGVYGITLPVFAQESGYSYSYVLGILNCSVVEWVIQQISSRFRGGYFSYAKRFIEQVPIPSPRPVDSDRIESLANSLASLHERLVSETAPQHKIQLLREIDAMDRQLDQIAYRLYALSDQQIRIVEETTRSDGRTKG